MHKDIFEKLKAADRQRLTNEFTGAGVYPSLVPGLVRYFVDTVETGGFLRAVLENNLAESFLRGDVVCVTNLRLLVRALHDIDLPQNAWGSAEKVSAWLERKKR